MAESSKQPIEVSTQGNAPIKTPAVRMFHPLEELEQLVDRMTGRGGNRLFWPFGWERSLPGMIDDAMESRLPAVDVLDRENELLVRAELPGIEKKDLDVSLADNMLTIKGSLCREEKEEKADYYRCEISRGGFSRSITLPCNIDASKVKAVLKDGVLEVTLVKAEQSRRQTIHVE